MPEAQPIPANPQINITMSILENKCDSFSLTPDGERAGPQLGMD